MDGLVIVLALTAFLFGLQRFLRFAGPWCSAIIYFVIPAVLTAYWLRVNDMGWFPWIKVYTVLFCGVFGSLVRYTTLGRRPWARFGITVLLAINILEAAVLSVVEGGTANYVNSIAALVLIAALPRRSDGVQVVASKERDLHLEMSRVWVLGYTAWNFSFVYMNYPQYTGHHIAVLASAMVAGLINPKLWVQARAYTLGAYFILMCTFGPFLLNLINTSDWTDSRVGLGVAVLALVFALGCFLPTPSGTMSTRWLQVRRSEHSRGISPVMAV